MRILEKKSLKIRYLHRKAGLTLHVLLTLLPLAAGAVYALLYSVGLAGSLAAGFTLRYWESLVSRGTLWQTFAYSAYIMGVSIVLSYASALAMVISARGRLMERKGSRIFYLPLAMPALVLAFFAFRFLSGGGWLASLAFGSGLIASPQEFPELVNDPYGLGIIFVHFLLAFAFFSIYLDRVYANERIEEQVQSAQLLGAGYRQSLRRVVWPMILRKTWPAISLYGLFVFGSYEVPLLLGRSTPEMLSVRIVRMLSRFNLDDRPEAFAIVFAYMMLTVLLVFLLRKSKGGLR